ncbi:hypothetical protein C8F01DRAFT_1363309 [Mycena amicta]|nr:hypothetical protein C8F01DRAFT_1363309 [Mycena amicta]
MPIADTDTDTGGSRPLLLPSLTCTCCFPFPKAKSPDNPTPTPIASPIPRPISGDRTSTGSASAPPAVRDLDNDPPTDILRRSAGPPTGGILHRRRRKSPRQRPRMGLGLGRPSLDERRPVVLVIRIRRATLAPLRARARPARSSAWPSSVPWQWARVLVHLEWEWGK